MNIIIYKGQFQYDVVNYFSEELGQGLKSMGHKVTIIDLRSTQPTELAYYLLNNDIDLILSFNGVNFTDKNVFEKLNIPLGIILVDHPFYHLARIKTYKGKTTFVCMYDTGHLDCFEECIDNNYPIAWLPHGGTEILSNDTIKKEYDVILPGTISNYKKHERELLDVFTGKLGKFTCELYEKAKGNYSIELYRHFKESMKSLSLDSSYLREDNNYLNTFAYIYTLVDKTLRSRGRYFIVKTLVDYGIHVKHYGNIHDNTFVTSKYLNTSGPIDYINLIKEIKKSKILLHDTPYFKNGSHERFLTSMLNGTLVLSNKNNYCNDQYVDGESIVFYDVNNLETLLEKAQHYITNKDDRIKIEKNAYKITKKYNTWENRAHEIINIYNEFVKTCM